MRLACWPFGPGVGARVFSEIGRHRIEAIAAGWVATFHAHLVSVLVFANRTTPTSVRIHLAEIPPRHIPLSIRLFIPLHDGYAKPDHHHTHIGKSRLPASLGGHSVQHSKHPDKILVRIFSTVPCGRSDLERRAKRERGASVCRSLARE